MPNFTLKYSEQTLARARRLRREMSNTERAVWDALRGDKLGVRFRRQAPFGPYILDFVCLPAKLAIELDGPEHQEPDAIRHDSIRDEFLSSRGIKTLRFENRRVQLHWDEVEREVREEIALRMKA